MQTIELEGRCFVISACQHLTRADCPADYRAIQGDDPATVLIRGGSCIDGVLGNILAKRNFEGELIQVAELDRGDIAAASTTSTLSGTTPVPMSSVST
jgi:nitrilase